MKLPPWWKKAAVFFLIFLVVVNFLLLPIVLFLAFLLFIHSDSAKKFFSETDEKKKNIPKEEISHKNDQGDNETVALQNSKQKDQNHKDSFFQKIPFTHSLHMNNKNNNSSSFSGLFTLALVGFLVFSVLSDGMVSIPAGHTGVVFSKLSGGIQDETLDPGIKFKLPFFETVTLIDTRLQAETINEKNGSIKALTSDEQEIEIDITVQYEITKENAPLIIQNIGLDYESKVVTPAIRSIVREVITAYKTNELSENESRVKVEEEIETKLKENFGISHIVLVDALIRKIKFSDEYKIVIDEKQAAQVRIQKSEFERDNAKIQAEKMIIEAKAEAQSISLKGEMLSKYPEVIQLQFVDKMSPSISWGILEGGSMPLIDVKGLTENK